MAVALRQLVTKRSAAQAALLPRWVSSGGGVVLRKKISEQEIERRRYISISQKIEAQYDALPCCYYDNDSLLKLDRIESNDFGVLKSLLKDLRKINRKNGVVAAPPKKTKMVHRHVGGGAVEMFKRNVDDDSVIETAEVAMKKYKKEHKIGSSLEFVSVLQVHIAGSLGLYDIMIQARDLTAAGVSIKLLARCVVSKRRVFHVALYRPVPFMDLLHKDESKKTGDVEALLYANLRYCPIIDRRLGLKRQELLRRTFPRSVVNLALDDDTVMRVAKFAVNQRPDLHFLAVTGAWRENLKDGRYLYHVIFEAVGDGLTRRFYSSISVNAEGGAAKLVDLKAVDCPRATIK